MKRFISTLLILNMLFCDNYTLAQKNNSFEKFKEMKMSFMFENTDLSSKEKDSCEFLFHNYEKRSICHLILFHLKMHLNTSITIIDWKNFV